VIFFSFHENTYNVHDIKVMAEKIDRPIRKLSENISLYLIIGHTKTRKFLLTRLKTKTMSSYYDIMAYNSSPIGSDGATSLSTLPINKSFMFFLYLFVGKNRRWQ